MHVMAIIPADHVPDAARILAGRSLVAHTILTAKAAVAIDSITVLTSDARVRRIAEDLGASVIRPGAAPTARERVRAAVLATTSEGAGKDGAGDGASDIAVVLDPACPLRSPGDVDQAVALFRASTLDSLVSVHPCGGRLWIRDGEGAVAPPIASGGQPIYQQNDALALVRVAALAASDAFPCGRIGVFEMTGVSGLSVLGDLALTNFEELLHRRHADAASALLAGVRMLVLDFDGVMSDNRVLVMEDGREGVLCNRGDGLGLEMLRKSGLPIAVISKEGNPVVTARCRKLKIPCEQGIDDKLTVLKRLAGERDIPLDAIAYVGNDVNDLECLDAVGTAIAPADSHPAVLERVDLVTVAAGGLGCVREICDLLLARPAPNGPAA